MTGANSKPKPHKKLMGRRQEDTWSFQAYKLGGIVAIGASRMGIDTCEKVKKLIDSIPRRCQQVKNNNGFGTKY